VLPRARGRPAIDSGRHAGTPAGEALAALLADGAPLVERYRTDVQRRLRRMRSGGATVEVAFDEGRIVAGGRRAAVFEVEFELVAGPVQGLLALAARWVQRHRLWIDTRTKSERGHRLAEGDPPVAPTKSTTIAWRVPPSPAQALAAMLENTLAQLLPNMAEIAAGRGGAEALHQLRVAIRRLRTALRLFGAWGADPAAAAGLQQRWREPFVRLGAARDADVLAALPALPLPALAAAEDPGRVVREPVFSRLVLDTLALAHGALPALESSLDEAAAGVLAKAWRGAAGGAAHFAADTPAARHRTRRRLKRLRYATEFLQPLLPARSTAKALAAMRSALDALGAYNDVLVGEARCQALDRGDPQVAYALGWLAARHQQTEAEAARRLAKLAPHKKFWR